MTRAAVAVAAALLWAPATADAATLTVSAGTLEYSADSGRRNVVTFEQTAAGTVRVERQLSAGGDEDAFTTVQGCTAITVAVAYSCTGVTRVVANGGDGDDRLDAVALEAIPATLRGGPGSDVLAAGDQADVLEGGDGDDTLTGGKGDSTLRGDGGNDLLYGGAGREVLDGGAGNDTLQGNGGADVLRGGAGVDTAHYADTFGEQLTVTLNDAPDDGKPGEGDHVGPDVENATVGSETPGGGPGVVRITGNAAANVLEVSGGNSTLTGGPGTDVLIGGPHADTIDARDGERDRVTCNAGADTVLADAVDDVAPDCENVQREAPPQPPAPPPPADPDPPARPPVRAFQMRFIARAALRGSEIGLLEEVRSVKGLRPRSRVTLRCLRACSRRVRTAKRVDRRGRVRFVLRNGLVLRRTTRVELRVSRTGERTRYERYRFVRKTTKRRGLFVQPVRVSRGLAG